jgi:hypothetical protein
MVDLLLSALLGGIAASARNVASQAVEDSYGALKALLERKLGHRSETIEAITSLEAKPTSDGRKATLAEELRSANVSDDPDLREAVQQLQAALDKLPAEDKSVVQQAVGSYIAIASGGSSASVNVGRKAAPSNRD